MTAFGGKVLQASKTVPAPASRVFFLPGLLKKPGPFLSLRKDPGFLTKKNRAVCAREE